jgi:hypothetical protein
VEKRAGKPRDYHRDSWNHIHDCGNRGYSCLLAGKSPSVVVIVTKQTISAGDAEKILAKRTSLSVAAMNSASTAEKGAREGEVCSEMGFGHDASHISKVNCEPAKQS